MKIPINEVEINGITIKEYATGEIQGISNNPNRSMLKEIAEAITIYNKNKEHKMTKKTKNFNPFIFEYSKTEICDEEYLEGAAECDKFFQRKGYIDGKDFIKKHEEHILNKKI